MQVLRHRLTDASGNPVAGHTAHVMEYETPEEAYYRGYRRVPIVTATSDDSGWLTWILPRSVSNVYVVNGIESLPVIVTVPYGVQSITVSEARTGIANGGVRLPATVDLVTELEMSTRLAGITRDLVGELVTDPAFMQELVESPDLLEALVARPELSGTPDPTPNALVKRDEAAAATFSGVHLTSAPAGPDAAARKSYVDGVGTADGWPDTIMRRDSAGWTSVVGVWQVEPQSDAPEALTRKSYVDALGTAAATADTVMRRDGTGRTQATGISGMDELTGDLSTIARTVAATVGFVKDWVANIGTALRTASTLVRRDAAGGAEFSRVYVDTAPVGADELTRKDYVDALGTDDLTPNTVVRRDDDGGTNFGWLWSNTDIGVNNAPTSPQHVTRKDYVDALGSPLSGADTIVRRTAGSTFGIGGIDVWNAPTAAQHATRKDYVDALGTALATPSTVVRRDASGNTAIDAVTLTDTPTVAGHATRKDYVDSGDTAAKARVNHTGTQASATIADLTETVQDIVGTFLRAGTGTTVTYDDALGTFTINASAGGTTDPEIVRDVIGTALVAGAGIQITVNDAGDTLTVASTAVLPTRQVISGTGLTGGGDLSADRTLAVTYGTAAGTAAEGNDSRITGAVPSTRTISPGTGLTGGGDLTVNRALAVSYGSTAGTAVQGNDTRVVANQAAGTASIRSLGTGATQAAAGNHTHSGMVTGTGITAIQALTQTAYDAIVTKSTTTLYVIQG